MEQYRGYEYRLYTVEPKFGCYAVRVDIYLDGEKLITYPNPEKRWGFGSGAAGHFYAKEWVDKHLSGIVYAKIRQMLLIGESVTYDEMADEVDAETLESWWVDGIDGWELWDDPEKGVWYLAGKVPEMPVFGDGDE